MICRWSLADEGDLKTSSVWFIVLMIIIILLLLILLIACIVFRSRGDIYPGQTLSTYHLAARST